MLTPSICMFHPELILCQTPFSVHSMHQRCQLLEHNTKNDENKTKTPKARKAVYNKFGIFTLHMGLSIARGKKEKIKYHVF